MTETGKQGIWRQVFVQTLIAVCGASLGFGTSQMLVARDVLELKKDMESLRFETRKDVEGLRGALADEASRRREKDDELDRHNQQLRTEILEGQKATSAQLLEINKSFNERMRMAVDVITAESKVAQDLMTYLKVQQQISKP